MSIVLAPRLVKTDSSCLAFIPENSNEFHSSPLETSGKDVKIHSKRAEKMCKLHSERGEKIWKLHSERGEKIWKLHSKRVEKIWKLHSKRVEKILPFIDCIAFSPAWTWVPALPRAIWTWSDWPAIPAPVPEKYTPNEWKRCEPTLETSGED